MKPTSTERLLTHLAGDTYRPSGVKELARDLDVPPAQYREFRRLVRQMESDGVLLRLRHSRYALPATVPPVLGVVRRHPRGYGWVDQEGRGPDIWVRAARLGGADEGDVVRVGILSGTEDGRGPEGLVLEVVERRPARVVGTAIQRGRRLLVRPDDPEWGGEFVVDGQPTGVEPDHKVVIAVGPRVGRDGARHAEVTEILGDPDDPRADFAIVARSFALPEAFRPEVLAEAEALGEDLESEAARRRDLRHSVCLTIDPPTARDYDDAVSLEVRPDGYLLGVHIADVSHFVREGTAVDREARRRGTSAYLLDRVVPMLPERLADDLCTLTPGQDRLAVSVLMQLDREGVLLGYEVVDSLVRSAARLNYDQVQAAFDGAEEGVGDAGPWRATLVAMRELSRKLRRRRQEHGALDLGVPEPAVVLGRQGQVRSLGRQPRLESHQLIEEYMLAANRCVGHYASDHGLPVLYRVHRPPDPEKLRSLAEQLGHLGIRLRGCGRVRPRDLQAIGESAVERADAGLVHRLLLRAMRRAEYAPQDSGHFGLACHHYLHFTSPIRRYPDLWVHRAVKAVRDEPLPEELRQRWEHVVSWLGEWSSRCERRADEAERAYVRTKQLRYLAARRGQEFAGLVSGVVRGGVFVELEESLAEGFCPVARLTGHWEFDARRRCLLGRNPGSSLGLGTAVQVRVNGVDLPARRLDLQIVQEQTRAEAPRPRRRPAAPRRAKRSR